jgi:hypothetical protein
VDFLQRELFHAPRYFIGRSWAIRPSVVTEERTSIPDSRSARATQILQVLKR